MVTIFKDIFSKDSHFISVDAALDRIKSGKSKERIKKIRKQIDKERANELKLNLPSVVFAGEFKDRKDEAIIKHSNFIVLDFDELEDAQSYKEQLSENKYIYAAWISPRANGVKALVRVKDGKKHREHFKALQNEFDNLDESGINISRVCFESYDPNIYINKSSEVFTEAHKEKEHKTEKLNAINETEENFNKLLTWLANRGDAFRTGERNLFIYKLAGSCCRFGIDQNETESLIIRQFSSNDFSIKEIQRTVKSAYSASDFGIAEFSKDLLVDRKTKKELPQIDESIYDKEIKPKDVIFGEDVKADALKIFNEGYEKVEGIGVEEIDQHWKMKSGEITLLTGIGNYGKSSFLKWYLVNRILKFGDKFALFAPEDNPAQELYHDFVEILLGDDCTPRNPNRPREDEYLRMYEFISDHIFYIYPKSIAPTPEYIKERFLELIIKENVTGCIIDPFNQMSNDYGKQGGRSDKYLETFLSDCSRFAQVNNIFFVIVAHPHKLQKDADGNYPAPDVYQVADGAMWNNKMDNIIVYHRPNHQKEPNSSACELHSKKIRRQKTVGIKGIANFDLNRQKRRYIINGQDNIAELLGEKTEPIKTHSKGLVDARMDIQQMLEIADNTEDQINDWLS